MRKPKVKNKGGKPQIYKHFAAGDKLYYRDEGKIYCICDDKQASGYIIKDHQGEDMFLPQDFTDLVSYDSAKNMCDKHSVHMPQPGHLNHVLRVPPPLFVVSTPQKKRPMWNRDAINRHIQECLRRRHDAGIR
jgi:hypothetical protein